jgi:putative ABC transport system substrate-binding protein
MKGNFMKLREFILGLGDASFDRRAFLALLGGAAAWPLAARAQQHAKMPTVGVLWHANREEEEKGPLIAFRRGLKNVGYVEGENIVLEDRFPNEDPMLFKQYAQELAALRPDVLATVTRPAAIAMMQATSTIPTVFIVVPDPIGSRIVDNLARPRDNVTGLSTMAVELTPKRIEILKETIPDLERVALIVNMSDPVGAQRYIEAAQEAAKPLGVVVQRYEVRQASDFEGVFARVAQDGQQAVVLMQDGLFYAEQRRIGEIGIRNKMPIIAFAKELSRSGMLMSYGPNIPGIFMRAGVFIDKILKGAKPSDLPVEQPTKFELFVNGRTAKAIGLTLPPMLLARADEVIE